MALSPEPCRLCISSFQQNRLDHTRAKRRHMQREGYLFFAAGFIFFLGSCFPAFLLLSFSASLLFCFSVFLFFLLLCFSAFGFSCFSAFLLLCFSASLFFFPVFFASLLFAFPAYLLFCFSVFLHSFLFCLVLLRLSTFTIPFFLVMWFCCSTSCPSVSLLIVCIASLFFILFCFILPGLSRE